MYKRVGPGEFVQIAGESPAPDVHAVHQDSMDPLTHPVTGEIVTSRARWARINMQHKLEEVGTERLSEQKRNIPDRLTESRIRDAMEKAESIVSDPAKLNARRNLEALLRERNERLLNGRG